MTGPSFAPALLDHYTELVATVLYLGRAPERAPDIDRMAALLEQLLKRSQTRANKNGLTEERWLAGLYPVVAWIDEQLLNMDWPGKRFWAGRSLQRKLYQTTLAGRDFFVRLDKLPADDRPLREVYDLCLALGFRGQYFDPEDTDRLRDITHKNLQAMQLDLPLQLPDPLFADSESKVVFKGVQGYHPDNPVIQGLLWLLPALLLLGLYFALRGSLPAAG
nr:DotU family type IV/VI secretion system protein [uncultured Desulfobulbus sp.]